MLNRWGDHYSERGNKASSRFGKLKAQSLRRKAEFEIEDREGLEYVVPSRVDVDYEIPTVMRRNPDFQVEHNL